jgi:hypothetical protein
MAFSALMLLTITSCTEDESSGSSGGTGGTSSSNSGGAGESAGGGAECQPEPATSLDEAVSGYVQATQASQAEERACLVAGAFSEQAEVRLQREVAVGHAAISDLLGVTTFDAVELSQLDETAEFARFAQRGTGSSSAEQLCFVERAADNRLAQLVAFEIAPPAMNTPSAPLQAYLDAWNEHDEVTRLALLETAWTENGRYVDPTADATGRDGLSQVISAFQAQFADVTLVLGSGIETHGNWLRWRWEIRGADNGLILEGTDVAVVEDSGKVLRIVGFFGGEPELP